MALSLAVVTPEKEALRVECDEVVAPSVAGEVGLLPGHIPIITSLKPGVLTVIQGGSKQFFAVSDGYAELDEGSVTVLTGSCEAQADIDPDRAKDALKRAEEALADKSAEDDDYIELLRRQARALARLDVANRK